MGLATADAAHPGERILVGIAQTLKPEWHTSWINPGDTGVPTHIDGDRVDRHRAQLIQFGVRPRSSQNSGSEHFFVHDPAGKFNQRRSPSHSFKRAHLGPGSAIC